MRSRKNKIVYIDETAALVIHAKIIDATGGSHGIRNIELVKGALERPQMQAFGRELHSSLFEKAAAYFDSISKNHPFTDGNKRTAFALAVYFLNSNGFEFGASDKEVERYVVLSVVDHHSIEEISSWLKLHSKKQR